VKVAICSGLRGWAQTNDCVDDFKRRLKTRIGNETDIEVMSPHEEAVCLFLQVVPQDLDDAAVVIDVGSGNIKAGYFDRGGGNALPDESGIKTHIMGTKSLISYTQHHYPNRFPIDQAMSTVPNRRDYAGRLDTVCSKEIGPVLLNQAQFAAPLLTGRYVYLVGEAAWAACRISRPDAPVLGDRPDQRFVELTPKRDFDLFNDRVIEEGNGVYDFPPRPPVGVSYRDRLLKLLREVKPENQEELRTQLDKYLRQEFALEQLLAAAAILRRMDKALNLSDPSRSVLFVNNVQSEWLFTYLERRVNAR
jgi:hypothetical protein